MRWVIGIVVVVVLVIIGYQYFGQTDVDVAEQADVDVAEPAEQAAEETEQAAEETAGAVEETTEEAAEATEEVAGEAATATEQAAEATEETAEEAMTVTEQAGEQAAEATGEAAGEVEEATEALSEEVTQEAEQLADEVAEETEAGTEETAGSVQEELAEAETAALVVGDVNVGEQVTGIVQNVEESLQGITDAQSAEAAVPTLDDINARLEELAGTVDQLPDDAKKVLADLLSERVAELKTLADDVTAQEGVEEVVNPALEPIIAKLEDWTQAPA